MSENATVKRILDASGVDPRSFRYIGECGSTNILLKSLAASGEALPSPLFLAAGRQTDGRGRLGRSFFSPPGTGMYLSVLISRPELSSEDLTLLTPAAAVAVSLAIESVFRVPTGIKWVNDVYAGGKKVCGILTESALDPDGRAKWAVIGIGVNVCPPEGGFPEDISQRAGAVRTEYRQYAVEDLTAAVIRSLSNLLPRVENAGFVEDYRRRLMYVGQRVNVIRADTSRSALVLGCDGRCGLKVRYDGGAEEMLTSGEITLRPEEAAT